MARCYLDAASTWPLRPAAAQAMHDAMQVAWADPTRRYAEGRAARRLLEQATATVAEQLGARDDAVVWTSGGTEAVHLAVQGAARWAGRHAPQRRHVIVSAVEHSAVLHACDELTDAGFEVTTVPVDAAGLVSVDAVAAALRDDTLIVHLQHANHEVGAIQPTHEVGALCREAGAMLHVDACQTVGQLGVTLDQTGADLLSLSAHKFGGPSGVGALVVGPRSRLAPLLGGDDRQLGRRAGRVDIAAIAGAAVALQVATDAMGTERSAREVVRRYLRAALADVPDVAVHGPLADAHPGIVAVSALYVSGESLVVELDEEGFAVHSGSACAATSDEPSHVLMAMGALTHGHVRISFAGDVGLADAERFVAVYRDAVTRLRDTTVLRRLRHPDG